MVADKLKSTIRFTLQQLEMTGKKHCKKSTKSCQMINAEKCIRELKFRSLQQIVSTKMCIRDRLYTSNLYGNQSPKKSKNLRINLKRYDGYLDDTLNYHFTSYVIVVTIFKINVGSQCATLIHKHVRIKIILHLKINCFAALFMHRGM